ncbi:MAG: glutamine--fructose-6-phosphate transaminase (isomerizing) [Mycolicibacterium rufum]|uniref:Glutamine--fructose-6-phosphate aminotransferase [isomerizing] n=1 Tax=Mycolicibacterium chlorophenolicum TaxID=37916 RepID=A0A0J6ZF51_9MYCO|nr:glutamine--fructose-6-phosphate transaminase (isomerizing) [Mycolicibacterium chlorophenolicum]KMO83436.1 Glutamine--fructose-6-phosphate aminotransferase [isomerizing] [Mycolicibacterium chlorophenolicum]MBI5336587.1 glutamine--fructose-6-phosphate transaminase (isomerizing) [Mycolicibacterium rufum]
MCGIIACRTHRPASEYLRIGLRRLEYRGYDSVGVALQAVGGDVLRLRTIGRINSLETLLGQCAETEFTGAGIGHTRWATHGSVTEDNAHPHADCTGEISVVHNGIIENAASLRAELACAGHSFATPVDSEVLCHLIEDERLGGGDLVDAVHKALSRVQGSWAIAVLEEGTGRIAVAAKGSPLLVAHTDQGDFAASDIAAIADWIDEFRVLEDGDVVELTNTQRWCHAGVVVSPPMASRCDWRSEDVELHDYTDYMAKEIDEQPHVAARVLDGLIGGVANGRLWNDLGLPAFGRLQVIGCGTSLNAGNVIANLVRSLGALPVTTVVASEAAAQVPDPDQLCLAVSQSGETADVLRAMESSAVDGSYVLALTNNSHSTLARLADAVIECSAGPEIGVAASKTFVCQVISGSALMISALVAMNRLSAGAATRLVDDLRRVPDQLAAASTVARGAIPPIVDEFVDADGFIFIGRGSGLPYAAEGALKLKELTYRWAECCPAGELKHGPLALVGPGTPIVVVDSGEPKLACNVAEVASRGGRIVTLGPAGSSVPVVDNVSAPWGPIGATVPLQVLARSLALTLGRDVDKPRNLAKSVTVE